MTGPSPELWLTLDDAELAFIASRDYGQDTDKHLAALRTLVFEHDGVLQAGQYWFPYEVVELCATSLEAGHEREFTACTLLILKAIAEERDRSGCATWRFGACREDYERLPAELRAQILERYAAMGIG